MKKALVWLGLVACVGEPAYEGRRCGPEAPCPGGLMCIGGICGGQPDAEPEIIDVGVDAEIADIGFADIFSPDAEIPDLGFLDAQPPDADPPDSGNPSDRCREPVLYPSAGWQVRYFGLAGGNNFDQCIGIEEVATDGISMDYDGNGPFGVLDFGARWTATRTFLAGVYTFRLDHDDGVRLLVDGQIIYEDWDHGAERRKRAYTAYLSAGDHQLTVEHFDDEGFADLTVSWERGCLDLEAPVGSWLLSYHRLGANNSVNLVECFGFELVAGINLSVNWQAGAPLPLQLAGLVDNWVLVGRSLQNFRGLTDFDFLFEDGLRATAGGQQVVSQWQTGGLRPASAEVYLRGLQEIYLEKFDATGNAQIVVDIDRVCDEIPALDPDEWFAAYFGMHPPMGPQTWALDRDDCLGAETLTHPQGHLIWGTVPAAITARNRQNMPWGAEYRGNRTFMAQTPASLLHDDGLRIYSGANILYESWTEPQVINNTVLMPPGSLNLRLEYFQGFGGAQLRMTW